jgi:hypothetical protein
VPFDGGIFCGALAIVLICPPDSVASAIVKKIKTEIKYSSQLYLSQNFAQIVVGKKSFKIR